MKPIQKKYYGGILNSLTYKSFEFSFLLQFSKGNTNNWLPASAPGSESQNFPAYVTNHWIQEGDETKWGKFTNQSQLRSDYRNFVRNSDLSVTDASFIRLRTVSLSYRVPVSILNKAGVNDFRIYLQGQNLLTKTDYVGLDPETGNGLPPLRMFTIGIQAKL
jgi:hypothetical protein